MLLTLLVLLLLQLQSAGVDVCLTIQQQCRANVQISGHWLKINLPQFSHLQKAIDGSLPQLICIVKEATVVMMTLRSLLFIDSLAICRQPSVCAEKKTSIVLRTREPWSRLHNTDVTMARHQELYQNWGERKPYNGPREAQCFTIRSMKSPHCTALPTVTLGVTRTPKDAAWHSAAHVRKKPLYNI